MASVPISRHYDYGRTFRWIKGESHIVVKRGYVCENRAFYVVQEPRSFAIIDRPMDDPHNDKGTWLATIPANPAYWADDNYFLATIEKWVQANPHSVDLNNRTNPREAPYGLRAYRPRKSHE